MKKLLIATHNPAKFRDIARFLTDVPVQLVSLSDVGIIEDIEEDGKTFEENAIKKATYYAKKSGLPTLGDDSGMEIDYLGGKPGVLSKRWAKDETDESIISHTLEQLKGIPKEKRSAQFRVAIALAKPDGTIKTSIAVTKGIIAEKPYTKSTTKKFPYNQLLFLPELGKYYHDDELTNDEQYEYNHRRRALDKLKQDLLKL